jgi:nitrogen fixation/metabolism regulation signal transduction histidine kinase
LASGTDWIFNYVVAMITPIAISRISWRFYILFTVCNFLWAVVVYFIIVETAKMSLDEIDEWFARDFHERRGESYTPAADRAFSEKKQSEITHIEMLN